MQPKLLAILTVTVLAAFPLSAALNVSLEEIRTDLFPTYEGSETPASLTSSLAFFDDSIAIYPIGERRFHHLGQFASHHGFARGAGTSDIVSPLAPGSHTPSSASLVGSTIEASIAHQGDETIVGSMTSGSPSFNEGIEHDVDLVTWTEGVDAELSQLVFVESTSAWWLLLVIGGGILAWRRCQAPTE
ncbi:MAG: hypothetical protein ACFB21_04920 [Opitutales bacterium]